MIINDELKCEIHMRNMCKKEAQKLGVLNRILINELISLRVAFIARVTSYELFLLYKLRVTFCIRVTSYC